MKKIVSKCCHARVEVSDVVVSWDSEREEYRFREFKAIEMCTKCGKACVSIEERDRRRESEDFS